MSASLAFARDLLAFLRRDLLLELSYRFALVLHYSGLVVHLVTFYYVSRLVQGGPWLEPYGGEYFPFVALGIAFSGFLGFGLSGFSNAIRLEQYYGTLEALLSTPVPAWKLALLATISGYVSTVIEALVYLAAGWSLGLRFPSAAWGPALVVAALTAASFSALGVLAASFIVYFKRGDPINWMIGTLSHFLGGVYFPVAVLPAWLAAAAKLLPVTHGLEALRRTMLQGAGLSDVRYPVLALAAFAAVGWPVALWSFTVALNAARRRATLSHY